MDFDFNNFQKIVEIFDESTADKIEIEADGFKIKLARNIQKAFVAASANSYQIPPQQTAVQAPVNIENPTVKPEPAHNLHEVKSPIVGTFYRAPSPDSDPFVEVGSKVKVGHTLCIIEAMKLMNEIESDASGIVEKILVNNADPVEYNQPIFVIKPE